MSRLFLLRLGLDGLAAMLMIAALAYYWLDNLAHEMIGTAVFGLIGLHAWFNRRWYGALARGRYDAGRVVLAAVALGFLAVMAVLLGTSLLVSRSLFAFLGIEAGYSAREGHLFAAYWAVAFLGVHLGLNWQTVMNVVRGRLGLRRRHAARTWTLRAGALAVAAFGGQASSDMTFGTKLAFSYALDMWDFNAETPRFFLNYGAILGLYATLAHYAMALLRQRRRHTATN